MFNQNSPKTHVLEPQFSLLKLTANPFVVRMCIALLAPFSNLISRWVLLEITNLHLQSVLQHNLNQMKRIKFKEGCDLWETTCRLTHGTKKNIYAKFDERTLQLHSNWHVWLFGGVRGVGKCFYFVMNNKM